MSKSDETVSGVEQEGRGTASVFDFLYNDSRRVGSYLAQLDENGLLTEIRQGEQVAKRGKRGFNYGIQILGTGGNVERTPEEGGSESAEHVYDPFWANARELLDTLDDQGMIRRDLSTAPIGSLVLLSGQMSLVDLSLIKTLWELPSMKEMMVRGMTSTLSPEPSVPMNRQGRKAQAKHSASSRTTIPLPPEMTLMLEMLPILPHSLNVIVSGPEGAAWAGLKEEHLMGRGSDLVLKHGLTIPGEWQMLGILDAHPDLGGQADIEANSLINFADLARLDSHSLVGQMASIMSPVFRVLLGRPGTHSGITPLLIFRQVGRTGI